MYGNAASTIYKDEMCCNRNNEEYDWIYFDNMPLIDFFNYFMEECYNKEYYLCKTTYKYDYYMLNNYIVPEIDYDDVSKYLIRKILNYKEMRNLTVIFKILFRIIIKL